MARLPLWGNGPNPGKGPIVRGIAPFPAEDYVCVPCGIDYATLSPRQCVAMRWGGAPVSQ